MAIHEPIVQFEDSANDERPTGSIVRDVMIYCIPKVAVGFDSK